MKLKFGQAALSKAYLLVSNNKVNANDPAQFKSEIEWTMYSEMTLPDLCFSFFTSFAVCAVVPLLFIIVFKSELKQASFGRLKDSIKSETVVVGAQDTTPDANFKLVRAWGKLQTSQPLRDELFGIEVTNALRLSRRVEMYQYCKKSATDQVDGSDSEEQENTQLDSAYELKFSQTLVQTEPGDFLRQNPSSFPFASCQKIAKKAHLQNFELSQEQCAKLGRFQSLKLSDKVIDAMIERIRTLREFQDYKVFLRHKNFLICRLEAKETLNEFGLPASNKKQIKYQFGDIRIFFEVVPCA